MVDLSAEIEIKYQLLVEGIRVEEAALEGVGTKYKENIYFIFDYDAETQPGLMYPAELKLPLGSVCMARINPRSPYLVKREEDALIVEREGKWVSTLQWTERPQYYDQLTSDGVEMKRVAQLCGEDYLIIIFNRHCLNWEGGNQCRFCNYDATQGTPKGSERYHVAQKRAEQVGEVVAAAMQEGVMSHLVISGGVMPKNLASEITVRLLEAIRERTGLDRLPATINIAPPQDLSEIDRIYQAGAQFIGFNLEVWDRNTFKAICPGKEKNLGREAYERALEYSVPLFGRGNVMSTFVLGLEEKENYFEAADWLAGRGIFLNTNPWIPVVGSKLEGHRAPHPEWMMEVDRGILDIMAGHMPEILTEEYFGRGMNGCYRCQFFACWWDEIRRRLGGITLPLPRERAEEVFPAFSR